MTHLSFEEDVGCLSSKASVFGTSLPVWTYWLDGLLIDAGPYSLGRDLIPLYRKLHIQQVALTHYHEDHSGLAACVQNEKHAPVHMPSRFKHLADKPARLPVYRRLFWGKRPAFTAHPLSQSISTGRYRFQVIPAPGHTQDHVVFWEPNCGWLFSGDVFVRSRPELSLYEEDMSGLIQTLQVMAGLDFDTLFCSHAGPQREGKRLLVQKLEYLLHIQDKARQLHEQGWPSRQIARTIFPKKRFVEYISRGEWSRENLVKSLL
ncbi:MBL fold metallo-hydrolase [Desulfovermiculus halophilus]|uniref:MBL fold metallo-hydrolase n=1 Tax=Desulfovermiculus halophilus TaxID=339722 RepID=UPI000685CEEC|nr:MBL fold metallo-hydrolase [Desulfovermiculus halophilus]